MLRRTQWVQKNTMVQGCSRQMYRRHRMGLVFLAHGGVNADVDILPAFKLSLNYDVAI